MKKSKVLISTSSIAQKTIDILSNSNFDLVINKYGKKLTVDQLLKLGYGCNGIIAGLEKYSSMERPQYSCGGEDLYICWLAGG